MGEAPIISIIIPVYNVQDYIIECLDSIVVQSYTNGVECILVDDCGADDSMRLVQTFLDDYKGEICFRIFKHKQNKGLSAARNTGIKKANGKYVLFIDSDDTISTDCIRLFMEVATKYPDAEMIAAGAKTTRKNWEDIFSMEKKFPDYANNPQWISRTILMRGGKKGIPVTAWNRMVRKDFIIQHQLFFREGALHEDELWNYMLSMKLSCIAFCKHDTYFYRLRPNSIITGFKTEDENALSCIPIWHEMLRLFTPEMKKEQMQSLWNFINNVYPNCHTYVVRKKTKNILWHLVRMGIWPTSFFIFLYLMPFIFYIKFIRKLVTKMSRISVRGLSPTL